MDIRQWFVLAFCASTALGCSDKDASINITHHAQQNDDKPVFYFGFDLRSAPQEDAKQYIPFLKYLNKTTEHRFELRFTGKGKNIVDQLGKGEHHFAALGATSYILAREKYDVRAIVRGKNSQNKAEYRSYLVVKSDSPITQLKDIIGKRFAFGSETSTQGHLIPRIILQQQEIKLSQLSGYDYYGSHLKCVEAVISNKADVCGMQDTMAEELSKKGYVRIIYKSDYFPSSGIAANGKVPEEVIQRVKTSLLQFDPTGREKPDLYNWHKTEMPLGFVAANESDYDSLRDWMKMLSFLKGI
ncbi:MAG: phosphate/phosphite/phosphonate ABC transporter substrate-binding protein [Gammaproteobacteria bacterium]|nr:phosphate/phosphite/phosphonate ABC transporter substrate-binding protein [Gammaproteobacteria bacterium]MDH5802303.1 phosphate/phosphite/phosphonate ABC transporter substrate-binding protein [Gammaproteobacteria bacterium]